MPNISLNSASGGKGVGRKQRDVFSEVQFHLKALYAKSDISNSPLLNSRNPNSFDDASRGYATGHIWFGPNNSVWVAQRVSLGSAVWQRQFIGNALAGDVASGLAAAYGVRRLVAAYGTGAAIDVVRASDSTSKTINFLPNGDLDANTLYGFVAGTTFGISKFYEQLNGNHAVQTVAANRPTLSMVKYNGNSPAICFDSTLSSNGVSTPTQFLAIPDTLTGLSTNSVSVVALASGAGATRSMAIVELSPNAGAGATLPLAFGNTTQSGIDAMTLHYSSYSANRTLTGVRPPQTPFVAGFASQGGVTLWNEDRDIKTQAALAATQLQGGSIGTSVKFVNGGSIQQYGYLNLSAILIYNKGISQAEKTSIEIALKQDFQITSQIRDVIIHDGDSITEGAFSSNYYGWPRQALGLFNSPVRSYNAALSGGTFATEIAQQSKWTPLLNLPGVGRKFVSCAVGSNDFSASALADATYANFLTWRANVLTAAPDALIVPCTLIPRSNLTTAKDIERRAYNEKLRNNWQSLGCVFLVDFDADPTLNAAAVAGGSYDAAILADGTHPTPLGYGYMAAVYAAAHNAYLAG